MPEWVPAKLRVIRTTRPKYACRACSSLVIAGGLATPALLTQVLVSKYCDHTPLYRQSRIFARHGVDLARSMLAGWVGGACCPLCADVFASDHLFADDTPVPELDPGRGRTKTGRLWVYAREQRGWGRAWGQGQKAALDSSSIWPPQSLDAGGNVKLWVDDDERKTL